MNYKGYEAVVVLDEEEGIFSGEVINTRDVITFQGDSVGKLKKAFEESVDDYLEFCKSRNEEPEKPFSGSFIVRTSPELHRDLSINARRQGISLNAYVIELLTTCREQTRIRPDALHADDRGRERPQRYREPDVLGRRLDGPEVTIMRPN